MSIVVDASVVVVALVDSGEEGRWAEDVLQTDQLIAPELMLIESTNVLRRLVARQIITDAQAKAAQRDLLQLEVEIFPFLPLADRVWSYRQNLTSYDATYVSLAESFDVPLATLDRKLASQVKACKFLLP